ncbi:MAG: M15 family metallopeptidase [Treponema sp.]|nr:M15 family metallopeptidase [Treponema sp.]MCL2238239.1 M15 family metallopeptidase [Treponema sp.]
MIKHTDTDYFQAHRRTYGLHLYTGSALVLFLIIFTLFLPGCRSVREAECDPSLPVASTLKIAGDLDAQHKILLAFAQGYPGNVSNVEFLNNDWTMLVNGKRFYYANGRFLPEEIRVQWENYLPYDFYAYPWKGTAAQRKIFIDNPVYAAGSSFLFETLYSSPAEDESWNLQEKYSFLGVKMLIHPLIKPKLDSILTQIRAAARTDSSINRWIAELHTGAPSFGWTWRVIAGTNRRSNHSYGTAIDLLPRDLKGRLTYWRWNSDTNVGAEIDSKTYYLPPETVIKIFEEHGFIWGGNWALIDTMHFEYRPEILILNDIKIKY